jgi:hypothetical protein
MLYHQVTKCTKIHQVKQDCFLVFLGAPGFSQGGFLRGSLVVKLFIFAFYHD